MGFGGAVTSEHPELGTGPIATEQNVSADFFERERDRIFKRVWLNVGRVDDIPNPGDYRVVDMEVLRASIVIVRGKDNEIRAFYNICPHRGNKIARGCRGKVNAFTCGFHGWVFDLKGRLAFVRDEEGFFNFNKADHGLTPVSVGEWEGFIFINADPHPAESLEEYLGPLAQSLKGYPFSKMELAAEYSLDLRANWKVAQDAFLESYHVGVVHKSTIPHFGSDENPYGRMLAFRLHKYHGCASVVANPDVPQTPVEKFLRGLGGRTFRTPGEQVTMPPGVNPAQSAGFRFDINGIFPNFIVGAWRGSYFTHNFCPISVNRTRYVLRFYAYPSANAGEALTREFTKIYLRDPVKEDVNTFEDTQSNMESGMLPFMILSDHEMLVRHKYKVVESFVKSEAYPNMNLAQESRV